MLHPLLAVAGAALLQVAGSPLPQATLPTHGGSNAHAAAACDSTTTAAAIAAAIKLAKSAYAFLPDAFPDAQVIDVAPARSASIPESETPEPAVTAAASARSARAVRARRAPRLDGREDVDDEVWRSAPAIDQFQVFDPTEGGAPRFRTVAKVAYDNRNLYVLVRAYDPHPDSIGRRLVRRDTPSSTDQITIFIDSYHDRRTAYEFGVNPSGVKTDAYVYNDGVEDLSWDAVWDVATRIDSAGWVAEFKIPLSQMRFPAAATHTFGFAVSRNVARYNERYSWPLYRMSIRGLASQFGTLDGITGLGDPGRLELSPYILAKNVAGPPNGGFRRQQFATAGGGIKYGISSNLTLDAALNPDFGQVEADPSVLNLTAYETYFPERRPFFLEGAGIYRFDFRDCTQGGPNQPCEGVFYSRRIGRAPQLASISNYSDSSSATVTPIIGAAKITGRTASGLSIGVLSAMTERIAGLHGTTLEPLAGYGVVRLQQDLRDGLSGVGLMFTGVQRQLDATSTPYLRRGAYTASSDFRHRFLHENYEVSGYASVSDVMGSRQAMDSTQQDSRHYYQRPGVGLGVDTTRTSLGGNAEELRVAKIGGGVWRWSTDYQRWSAGYEVNDVGFLSQSDVQRWTNNLALRVLEPALFYRRLYGDLFAEGDWTTSGLTTNRALELDLGADFRGAGFGFIGTREDNIGGSFCSGGCTRGGANLRGSPRTSVFSYVEGDRRSHLFPTLFWQVIVGDGGRSHLFEVHPTIELRALNRATLSVGPHLVFNTDNTQYYNDYSNDTLSIPAFGHLVQRVASVTARASFTATPNLSFEVYAEPYATNGRFTDLRALADPGAHTYDQRFQPLVNHPTETVRPGGFNDRRLHTTSVVRWEYRPGSTLFVVWSQGRAYTDALTGDFSMGHDTRALFGAHPQDTFLVKLSYWINP